MPELSAHDFVTRRVIACDIDTPHIHPTRRVRFERDLHPVGTAVNSGLRVYLGKSVSKVGVKVGKRFGGLRHFVDVIGFARTDGNQGLELRVFFQEISSQTHFGDNETFALGNVDGDANILLIWRDGDLGRIHRELQIAARQVIRTE